MAASWQTVAGGLGGLAARYGPEHGVSAKRSRDEAALEADGEFTLPIHHVVEQSANLPTERASVDVPLDASCRGFGLLQRMGWVQGRGLGRHGTGIVEPVRLAQQEATLGLGKAREYEAVAEDATAERRATTAELIAREADDAEAQRRREAKVHETDRIQSALHAATREFYCDVCHKQYKLVTEFDAHLSSYDHHHKKRFAEMRAAEAQRKRQEREAKEARRALKAERARGGAAPPPAGMGAALLPPTAPPPGAGEQAAERAAGWVAPSAPPLQLSAGPSGGAHAPPSVLTPELDSSSPHAHAAGADACAPAEQQPAALPASTAPVKFSMGGGAKRAGGRGGPRLGLGKG